MPDALDAHDTATTDEGQKAENLNRIVKQDGTPFETYYAADSTLKQKQLLDTHEVIPEGTGYAIVRKRDKPAPVKAPESIEPTVTRPVKDDTVNVIVKETGYVLCPKCMHRSKSRSTGEPCENPAKPGCTGEYGQDTTHTEETFWWVTFANKQATHESEQVVLSCQGETLVCRRNELVCIPGRFKEVAEHALRIRWQKVPGAQRKVLSPLATFPFTTYRRGTKAEYENMVTEGTAKTRRDIEQYGDGRPGQ